MEKFLFDKKKKKFLSMRLKNRLLIKTAQLTHLLSFMITEFMKAE